MRKYFVPIVALLALATSVMALEPFLPINCNFEKNDSQFHVRSSVLNTPVIRAYFYQGTNTWNATGHTVKFMFGRNENSDSMTTVTGTVSGIFAEFPVSTNDFSLPVKDWYAVVLVTSNTQTYSFTKGLITIERSPEVNNPTALQTAIAINGTGYGPFTGDFSGWPFLSTGSFAAVTGDMVRAVYDTDLNNVVDSSDAFDTFTNSQPYVLHAGTNIIWDSLNALLSTSTVYEARIGTNETLIAALTSTSTTQAATDVLHTSQIASNLASIVGLVSSNGQFDARIGTNESVAAAHSTTQSLHTLQVASNALATAYRDGKIVRFNSSYLPQAAYTDMDNAMSNVVAGDTFVIPGGVWPVYAAHGVPQGVRFQGDGNFTTEITSPNYGVGFLSVLGTVTNIYNDIYFSGTNHVVVQGGSGTLIWNRCRNDEGGTALNFNPFLGGGDWYANFCDLPQKVLGGSFFYPTYSRYYKTNMPSMVVVPLDSDSVKNSTTNDIGMTLVELTVSGSNNFLSATTLIPEPNVTNAPTTKTYVDNGTNTVDTRITSVTNTLVTQYTALNTTVSNVSLQNVVEDTTPTAGGNYDYNGFYSTNMGYVYAMTNIYVGTNAVVTQDTLVSTALGLKGGGSLSSNLTLSADIDYLATVFLTSNTNVFDEVMVANDGFLDPELILNGVFTNTTSWTVTNANIVAGDFYAAAGVTNATLHPNTPVVTTNGLTYYMQYDVLGTVGTGTFNVVTHIGAWTNTTTFSYIGAGVSQTNSLHIPIRTDQDLGIQVFKESAALVHLDNLTFKRVNKGDLFARRLFVEDFTVVGDETIAGNETVTGDLTVNGDATIHGTLSVGSVVGTNYIVAQSIAEGATQSFASGSGQVITNTLQAVCHARFTCSTNGTITFADAGLYEVGNVVSFQTGAAEILDCHFFTNGIIALDGAGNSIGWNRNTSASLNGGVVIGKGYINIAAGTIGDWRMEPQSTAALTWEHLLNYAERK